MVADGGEHVTKFPLACSGMAHAIRRQQRELERVRNFDGSTIAGLLLAMKVALQLHVYVAAAENFRQALDRAAGYFHAAMSESGGKQGVSTAGEADESSRLFPQFLFADPTPPLFCAALYFGDQDGKV